MKKIKEALHLGHGNVPPSAAQTTAAPVPAASTASTVPGTGVGAQPLAATGLQQQFTQTGAALGQQALGTTGLGGAPLGTTAAPLGTTGLGQQALGTTGLGAAPLGAGLGATSGVAQQPYLSSTATPGMATGLATSATTVQQPQQVLEKETRIIEEERIIQPTTTSTFATETVSAPISRVEAPVVEYKEKAPVVQEVIKPGTREEIQPVIHREREQLEIREEIQPIYEKAIQPTIVEERQLAPEVRPELRVGAMPVLQAGPMGSVVTEREHLETVTKPAIVEEIVHKKIIEEVQPVIHRETIAPKIIREVKPIYEKVIEAPVVTYETLPARYTNVPIPAPTPLVEETIVKTTTVEREFVPGTTSALTSGRAAPRSAPTGTTMLPSTTTTTGGFPASSTMGSTMYSGTTGATQAPVTEFREMKIEEKVVGPATSMGQQAPSSFQRY